MKLVKCRKSYKDQEKYRQYRNRWKQKYYDARRFCENHKMPWSGDEISLIMDHKIPDTEIAAQLGRSVEAIQIRRCKQRALLRKMEEADQAVELEMTN